MQENTQRKVEDVCAELKSALIIPPIVNLLKVDVVLLGIRWFSTVPSESCHST